MTANTQPVRIALDAMGGDFAPRNEVAGAVAALRHFAQSGSPVELVLFGRETTVQSALSALAKADKEFLAALPTTALTITHCDDVVTMEDDPASVARKRRGSSLYKGVESHAAGTTHAFVSAGNTGAVMSTGTLVLGRIAGVSRPTIGTFMPTTTNRPVLLVDAGANVDSKPRFLYEFAVMGSIYYRQILGVDSPKVGLLNVGEEETKGNEVALEARAMLAEGHQRGALHFVGNVEGRDILIATADVVVCDGFVGNIVLKFAESFLGFLKARFKSFADASLLNTILVGAVKPVLTKVLSGMDYQEYGGVPLLGVNGVVIIGHDKSTPLAIKNMILRAEEVVRKRVNETIADALKA